MKSDEDLQTAIMFHMFKMRAQQRHYAWDFFFHIWNISTSVSSISNSQMRWDEDLQTPIIFQMFKMRSDEETLPTIHSNVLCGSHHVQDEEEEEESSNIWWPELFSGYIEISSKAQYVKVHARICLGTKDVET